MGACFSICIGRFCDNKDKYVELALYDVGSTEAFDHICDICDKYEEVVAYCKQCEQYYCSTCSRCHKKVKSCQRHCMVDNVSDFQRISQNGKLFERKIAPASVKTILCELDASVVQCISFSKSTEDMVVLDAKGSNHLKVIKKDGSVTKASLADKSFHVIMCLSGTNNDVLLTLPEAKEVMKCNVKTENVNIATYFNTSGKCFGIAEFDNGFAVSINLFTGYTLPDWQVQYLDSKGNIKKQIYYDRKNKPLFSCPKYLASNNTQDILYVSDFEKHAVFALDVCGNVLFTFTNRNLKTPRAMAVDDEDNVYVACGDSVVQINKMGADHRVLLRKTKANPDILSVCFNPISRVLIVGEHSHEIKTFNFLPQKV